MRLLRYNERGSARTRFGIVEGDRVHPLKGLSSVAEVFRALEKSKQHTGRPVPLARTVPLPPTDAGARIFCAGLNYRDHAREIHMPIPKSPIFFTKTAGALCGALDPVIYPSGVRLLDYEVELAFVVGRMIGRGDIVRPDNIGEFVLGIAIFNDISARDVQLTTGQWFLGKTYRTFAPLGPCLQCLDGPAMERLYRLALSLQVRDGRGKPYDDKKQSGTTADMVFQAHDLINALKERFDLLPGDVIATGTPSGVALSRPSRIKSRIAEILGIAPGERIRMFIRDELARNTRYLKAGDTIVSRIASADGVVDLGEQRNTVAPDRDQGGAGIRTHGISRR
jgi:2-keto-4-pentenoate hydratase/2-oxohepta-3-ene-1,7-dioic acid hydratase in catechol pathway